MLARPEHASGLALAGWTQPARSPSSATKANRCRCTALPSTPARRPSRSPTPCCGASPGRSAPGVCRVLPAAHPNSGFREALNRLSHRHGASILASRKSGGLEIGRQAVGGTYVRKRTQAGIGCVTIHPARDDHDPSRVRLGWRRTVDGISDINPNRIHVTVGKQRRFRWASGADYVVHHEDLSADRVGWWQEIPTVTPATAISQCLVRHADAPAPAGHRTRSRPGLFEDRRTRRPRRRVGGTQ